MKIIWRLLVTMFVIVAITGIILSIVSPDHLREIKTQISSLQEQVKDLQADVNKQINEVNAKADETQVKLDNWVNPLKVYMGERQAEYMEGLK